MLHLGVIEVLSVWVPGLFTVVLLRGGDVGVREMGQGRVQSAPWKVLPEYAAHSEALPAQNT